MKRNLIFFLLSCFSLSCCSGTTDINSSTSQDITPEFFDRVDHDFGILNDVPSYQISDTKTVKDNADSFNFHGRHYYNSGVQAEFFNFSNSGFEVTFVGTTLEACFYATNADSDTYRPYIGVCVDGDYKPENATAIQITSGVNSNSDGKENGFSRHPHIVLACGLENKEHTVRVYKRSEVVFSKLGVKSVSTDGQILSTVKSKSLDLKMEFFGDSVTCGYGVEATSYYERFSTRAENSMKSFANYAANYLNADCSLVSVGGYPIFKSKYTLNNNPNNIPSMFSLADVDWQTTNPIAWDNSKYIPDVVVIALGANDGSYLADFDVGSTLYKYAINKYVETYKAFLDTIFAAYPNTQVIISSEILKINDVYETKMDEIVSSYNADHPSLVHKLVRMTYTAYDLSEDKTLPGEGHPNETMQHIAGKQLAEKLATIFAKTLIG